MIGKEQHVKIIKLQEEDLGRFIELVKLFERVFERENFSIPGSTYLQKLLKRPDFDIFVALKNDIVPGGLTIYALEQYYSEKPLAYLYDIAVDTPYQRQGIGKKLMEEVKMYYKQKGFEELFVQAEKTDEHAVDFYRKTHPSGEDHVVFFTYTLNA